MQVLSHSSTRSSSKSFILVFGLGLIGSAITKAARRLGYTLECELAYDWGNTAAQQGTFAAIESVCQSSSTAPSRVAIVWAAGQATFHSSEEDAKRELQTFVKAVELSAILKQTLRPKAFEFHLVSSAGGLFEGQTVIAPGSKPRAMRPYGHLKLSQEHTLSDAFEPEELAFHRPSSVYAPAPATLHKGLINNLIQNGRAGKVTVLDAHVMALRDYVYVEDVGSFIARTIRTGKTSESRQRESFLVSARSASIYEVVRKIERILNLKLRVRYDQNFGNHRNITFSKRVLPPGWKPTPLETGIRQFLVQQPRQT